MFKVHVDGSPGGKFKATVQVQGRDVYEVGEEFESAYEAQAAADDFLASWAQRSLAKHGGRERTEKARRAHEHR